jgi:hypothetical protein
MRMDLPRNRIYYVIHNRRLDSDLHSLCISTSYIEKLSIEPSYHCACNIGDFALLKVRNRRSRAFSSLTRGVKGYETYDWFFRDLNFEVTEDA